MSSNEEALVARLKEREATAMAEMYDRYGRSLYYLVLRSVGNPQVAEDLLQDICFRIWSRIDTFDCHCGTFQCWITAIARNYVVDHLRSLRHTPFQFKTCLADLEDSTASSYSADEADYLMSRMDVGVALDSLNQAQRQVLVMAYFQGFTHHEMALRLDKPLGTIKTTVRSALKILRESNLRPAN